MLGIVASVFKGVKVVSNVRKAIKEGKDVLVAVDKLRTKYEDLDDDTKAAWKEVEEFVLALRGIV